MTETRRYEAQETVETLRRQLSEQLGINNDWLKKYRAMESRALGAEAKLSAAAVALGLRTAPDEARPTFHLEQQVLSLNMQLEEARRALAVVKARERGEEALREQPRGVTG